MKVTFHVDADRLTLNDLIALEEENTSPKFQRDFLARFLVDDDGVYIEEEQAQNIIGNLSFSDLLEALDQFKEAVDNLQDNIVPKVSASP